MTTLATTSRTQVSYIKEDAAAWGTTPVTGNGRNLRVTGESLNFDYSKEESKELRSDRQVAGATTVDATSQGGLNFHLQYLEHDEFIEGALQSTFDVFGVNGVGATFTATFGATTITASAPTSGASIFTDLQKGQWFRLVAPTSDNNGLILRVSTTVAPTDTIITLDASTPCAVAVGVANCTVSTSRLTNGTTEASFSIEKNFADVTQFFLYKGMSVNKMSLNFAAGSLTDGSFDFVGKTAVRAGATGLPGTIAASKAYEIQNGVSGIGQLWEGTAPLTSTYVKTMSMNVDNSLRGRKALANLGNVSLGSGDFRPSGQIEVYFADGTHYDKFVDDTYTQLIVGSQDPSGNGYVYTMPRVLLSNGKITAGSKNADVMATFDWTAYSDDSNATVALRKTMFIDRVGVAVA